MDLTPPGSRHRGPHWLHVIEGQMDVLVGGRCEIVHSAVPGRLRLSVPGLKNNHRFAAQLENRLRMHRAARTVAANAATGNITLTYDPLLKVDSASELVDSARSLDEDVLRSLGRDRGWAESIETVLLDLDASVDGLTSGEVARRLKYFGHNVL